MKEYRELSRQVRKDILHMVHGAGAPHIGSSFSVVEILIALYFEILRVDPGNPFDPHRDRFILSKGHACPALYSVLAHRGFLDEKILEGFGRDGGTLEEHPAYDLTKGIELTTGSLGHGLSVGAGMALSSMYDNSPGRVFVLMSDGEVQSGFVWEAAMFAGHHGLAKLTAVIDYNKIQAMGRVEDINDLEPIKKKWESFGWSAREIDGHDYGEIIDALGHVPFETEKPSVIIAHTVKGKGVSFFEDKLLWHYKFPDKEELSRALKEILRQ